MKKLSMILAACAVAYLAIPIVADAQQTGVDRWGHAPVAPRFVSPDGGRVQGRASADGDQYVTGTVTANMVAPDGGMPVSGSVTMQGTKADGGTAAPLIDIYRRVVVSTGTITGACLGVDLTTVSAAGPTIPAGAEYRLCALTDLWVRYDGQAATADAPSEPIFARTCIVRGPYAAERTTTAILPAGASALATKEIVACPVTRPQ